MCLKKPANISLWMNNIQDFPGLTLKSTYLRPGFPAISEIRELKKCSSQGKMGLSAKLRKEISN